MAQADEVKEAIRIGLALVSVSDKTGLLELASDLASMGVEIISTGGTARALRDKGIPVKEVSEITGFPEMLHGRVKTLHPKIHGGILARRDLPSHMEELQSHGIRPIDLVIVNLYPFEETVKRLECSEQEAMEQVDIGGPCLIRAAAKNYQSVVVVVDPNDYGRVLAEMKGSGGFVSRKTSRELATKAFERTSNYDSAIARWMKGNIQLGK